MRVLVALSLLVLALAVPTTALAAPPIHDRVDLNDPALDAEESAWATDQCGFTVQADVAGHILFHIQSRPGPGTVELNVYGMRFTYRNPANGRVVRIRDVGPDRIFIRDGVPYVAVTGRSEGGTGRIGIVIINLETGEVVHQAGREIGLYWDRLCAALA